MPAEEADILSKLLAEVASVSEPNLFQEPAPKVRGRDFNFEVWQVNTAHFVCCDTEVGGILTATHISL